MKKKMYEECKQCKAAPAGSTKCYVSLEGGSKQLACSLNKEAKKEARKSLFPRHDEVHPAIAKAPVITAEEFQKRNGNSLGERIASPEMSVVKFLKAHKHY